MKKVSCLTFLSDDSAICIYKKLELILAAGYSGGHVSTVGSVLVTNLKTGRRYGGLDKAEVRLKKFVNVFYMLVDKIICPCRKFSYCLVTKKM